MDKTFNDLPAEVALLHNKLDVALSLLSQIKPQPTKKRLTIDEASEVTGYAKQTLYDKVSKGVIPYRKLGGKVYFDSEELENWIENGK